MSFVSPINTITLDCSGNVLPNALLLADVDGSKSNELLVGTQDGELFIYKFLRGQNDAKIWRRAQGLGFITAITVGNLATNSNEYRPVILVVNAEGTIHLFAIRSTVQRNRVRSAGGSVHSGGGRNDSKIQLQTIISVISNDDEQQQQIIQVAMSQQLICNPKILLFQDYNDIEKQIIIGYCDRTIRLFGATIIEDFDGRLSGRITLKNVFNIAEQIYTINTSRLSTKDYELIVSQPGGNIIRFNPNDDNLRIIATDLCNNGQVGWTEAIAVDKFYDETTYVSVCQDHIDIFSSQLNKAYKSIPLSVKSGCLCGLRKGPITKDDYNLLVVISSVDGDTFLIDRFWNIVRFRPPLSSYTGCGGVHDSIFNATFYDQIQAFTAGYFGDANVFSFVYVLTHNDKILIVHSVEINNSKTTNLINTVKENIKSETLTSDQINDLLHPPC